MVFDGEDFVRFSNGCNVWVVGVEGIVSSVFEVYFVWFVKVDFGGFGS